MRAKYQYVPYDPNDYDYFGCKTVVHAEWDYIYKRRASQGDAVAGTENRVSPADPESDGQGGFWSNVASFFKRARRENLSDNKSRQDSELKPASPPQPPDMSGIALSGGGIRSASFCLGILQALAYAGWLKKIDYMSTVSGGGYIGGSLSWLLHKKWRGERDEEIPYGVERNNFPYGSYPMVGMEDRSERGNASKWDVYKGRMLRHLRQHASYLMPGDGINMMSLVAVVLRNILFSVFVYGSLLIILFMLLWPYLFDSVVGAPLRNPVLWRFDWFPGNANFAQGMAILLALGFVLAAIVYVFIMVLLPHVMSTGYRVRYMYERWMGRLLTVIIVLTVIGFVPVVYCWIDAAGRSKPEAASVKFAGQFDSRGANLGDLSFSGSFKPPAGRPLAEGDIKLAAQNGKASDVSITANFDITGDEKSSQKSGWSLATLKDNLAAIIGGVSTLVGALSSVLAFMQERKQKKMIPTSVFVAVASVALIFGLLLLGYHFAALLRKEAIVSGGWKSGEDYSYAALAQNYWLMAIGALFLFFLRIPNLNYHSIHRYYRDRLLETFTPDLPDAVRVNGPVPGAAKSADCTNLYEMLNEQGGRGRLGPYHIINTNIVLVTSRIPKFRGRGGDNFILTPKYCGSNATGWCETRHSPYNDMTPPTALAISGAAVNSNTGAGGGGITRTPFLSFLMGFFNIRLGYWADNPAPRRDRLCRIAQEKARPLQMSPQRKGENALSYTLRIVWHGLFVIWRWPLNQLTMLFHGVLSLPLCAGDSKPNAFYPGLFEIYLRKNLDENSRMVQLSDGGHFENLGLYELIRRQLKLIMVCDGAADPSFGFEDFANAIEKVRVDFGALIDLNCSNMEALTPKSIIETGNAADKKVTYASQGYLVGRIIYKDRSEGTLLYMTTTFFNGLSADLYAYRKAHNEFPDQPTSDQFFDEKQFEAYRELGYQTAYKMMGDENVMANADVRNILGKPCIGSHHDELYPSE